MGVLGLGLLVLSKKDARWQATASLALVFVWIAGEGSRAFFDDQSHNWMERSVGFVAHSFGFGMIPLLLFGAFPAVYLRVHRNR